MNVSRILRVGVLPAIVLAIMLWPDSNELSAATRGRTGGAGRTGAGRTGAGRGAAARPNRAAAPRANARPQAARQGAGRARPVANGRGGQAARNNRAVAPRAANARQ